MLAGVTELPFATPFELTIPCTAVAMEPVAAGEDPKLWGLLPASRLKLAAICACMFSCCCCWMNRADQLGWPRAVGMRASAAACAARVALLRPAMCETMGGLLPAIMGMIGMMGRKGRVAAAMQEADWAAVRAALPAASAILRLSGRNMDIY